MAIRSRNVSVRSTAVVMLLATTILATMIEWSNQFPMVEFDPFGSYSNNNDDDSESDYTNSDDEFWSSPDEPKYETIKISSKDSHKDEDDKPETTTAVDPDSMSFNKLSQNEKVFDLFWSSSPSESKNNNIPSKDSDDNNKEDGKESKSSTSIERGEEEEPETTTTGVDEDSMDSNKMDQNEIFYELFWGMPRKSKHFNGENSEESKSSIEREEEKEPETTTMATIETEDPFEHHRYHSSEQQNLFYLILEHNLKELFDSDQMDDIHRKSDQRSETDGGKSVNSNGFGNVVPSTMMHFNNNQNINLFFIGKQSDRK